MTATEEVNGMKYWISASGSTAIWHYYSGTSFNLWMIGSIENLGTDKRDIYMFHENQCPDQVDTSRIYVETMYIDGKWVADDGSGAHITCVKDHE